jgi:hypothetical protein
MDDFYKSIAGLVGAIGLVVAIWKQWPDVRKIWRRLPFAVKPLALFAVIVTVTKPLWIEYVSSWFAPASPITVAVANFENIADDGDTCLPAAVQQRMTDNFSGLSALDVRTWQEIRALEKYAQKSENEAAQLLGIQYVLRGSTMWDTAPLAGRIVKLTATPNDISRRNNLDAIRSKDTHFFPAVGKLTLEALRVLGVASTTDSQQSDIMGGNMHMTYENYCNALALGASPSPVARRRAGCRYHRHRRDCFSG